jgi:catechol 2,3-dioxygenase-like lactoylglutathione lyase family enzyme
VTDPGAGDGAYDRAVLRVRGVDHLVMNVSDARRSVAWWRDLLGAEPLRVTEWEAGEVAFPSVRLDESTIVDLFELDRTGTNVDHVCVVVEGADLEDVAASGDFEVLGPPRQLFGARGIGTGLYVKDPDGNTVELRTYP